MTKFKLNVCSMGHPLNPKTWSATPYNICNELEKSGVLGDSYDLGFEKENKLYNLLLKATSKIYYNNSKDVARGILYRYYRSNKILRLLDKGSHTLHFGTSATPFFSNTNGQSHYLYTDTTWDLWASQSTEMIGYTFKLLRDAERLEAKSYKQFKHIFSISDYVKKNLIDHYGISSDKITVVGTGRGILEPYFGEKDYTNGKILFTAKGRFNDKGGDLVLSAFEKALKVNPNLQLTIVGQNEYSSKINRPNVTTLGFIALDELQNLFDTHSVFIMPALNEPWGLVYIEALACKMPIIGLNRNSFPEISRNGKYGYMLDSPNAEDLSDLLIKSIANPVGLQEKGLAGQQYCLDTFTWNKVSNTIIHTIQKNI